MRSIPSFLAPRQTLKVGALAFLLIAGAASGADSTVFVPSAVELSGNIARLPLYRGSSNGQTVYFVVLDASTSNAASAWGVNRSNKLANAKGTIAVQKVHVNPSGIDFPFTVDFAPDHILQAPSGFPPTRFQPGSRGVGDYTPLIEMPDGSVLNAPQIARDQNNDGVITPLKEAHDKIVSMDTTRGFVLLRETEGFANRSPVRYLSTDASAELAATLEESTFSAALNAAPRLGDDSTASARAALGLFINGQVGVSNPNRQGVESALAGEGGPLNVLAWTPNQGRYSPLWDVHATVWTAARVAAGSNVRQVRFSDIADLSRSGAVTGLGGAPWGPAGFVVNCPIISQQ